MRGLPWCIVREYVSLGEAEFKLQFVTQGLACELMIGLFNAHYIDFIFQFFLH